MRTLDFTERNAYFIEAGGGDHFRCVQERKHTQARRCAGLAGLLAYPFIPLLPNQGRWSGFSGVSHSQMATYD
jgi:hypothetical protein